MSTYENNRALIGELKHLAEAGTAADFSLIQNIEDWPAQDRETALLLKKILDNYQTAAQNDLMRHKLSSEALGVGHWDMDIKGGDPVNQNNKFTWSPELRRILGYSEIGDFPDTLANWLDHLHPDERNRVLGEFSAHAADRTGKTRFVTEHRLRKKNGEYLFVRTFGTTLRDLTGAPIRIAGAVEDITEAKEMRETLLLREKTLDILNRLALVLLAREEKNFTEAMSEGLDLISEIADIDRMSVFRNSESPTGLHLSQIYRWRKDANGTVAVLNELKNVPYSHFSPRLEPILSTGEYWSEQVSQMTGNDLSGQLSQMTEHEMLKRLGCVTLLTIPVFDDGKFWGFALFERFQEKNFIEQEISVLRSASVMLANAVIRNEEASAARRTHEQSQLMLDAVPLVITMMDKKLNIIDCWRNAVDVLGFSSKRDLLERLAACAPEYQPGGKRTVDMLAAATKKAFQTGKARLEWTLLTAGGEAIVFDTTLVRVKYDDDYALILYSRDIREEKTIASELANRDAMLATQAHWYKSLLDGIPLPLSVTDIDMHLTFVNAVAEKFFGRSREELIGRHCSIWNCPICNTENCSIVRAEQGVKQSFFTTDATSCKVETEIMYNAAGDKTGYLEILHDITEVENLARRQAEAANDAKSAFLATMSHEMRTPLSAVISLSELILENGGLSQENETYLDKIYNAGSTLLTIVNDILDISKIEAGKFEITPQEYDVPSLINDVITQNILRIHSKPVHFTLNINENVPVRLRGDDIRVKQIVSNLLSNAFKYTDEGKVELRIDYEREGDSVWTTFRVSDTGIGIKPKDLDSLFTDYTRFDGEANRKVGGTGLGLSITKRLVALMDGNITVTSEYGKGSVFTAKIRQEFVHDSVIGHEMAEHLRNFLYTTSKRRSGSQLNRVRIPYARVLVVDDNLTNLDIARGLMQPYGMEIDCVTNGQAAVDAVREEKNKYNAVFMDHMMPGMDGVEAVRIIREEIGSEYAKNVPIIALTANALSGNKERFISRGFNAFLSKPIDIFKLDAVIRRWIWDKNNDGLKDGSRTFVERRKRRNRRKNADRRVGERRKDTLKEAFSEAAEELDWMKGIELFGDPDTFRQVLRSFAVNTRPLLDSLSETSEETLPQYAITVHGIKSASRGIGAGTLGNMAESLEFAAKDGNLDFVLRHHPDFLKTAGNLVEDIEMLLAETAKAETKPQIGKPSETELKRLCTACEEYNMDEIEAVMREIESYEYTVDNGLADWLSDNIARLNYAQVIERIRQVTKEGYV